MTATCMTHLNSRILDIRVSNTACVRGQVLSVNADEPGGRVGGALCCAARRVSAGGGSPGGDARGVPRSALAVPGQGAAAAGEFGDRVGGAGTARRLPTGPAG